MNKTTLFLKLTILFILPFTLFFLSGCASTQAEQGTDWETWVGELTGMIDADLKMFFSREEEINVHLVKGTFKGDIGRVSGEYGSGRMSGEIKGKVKDDIFNVRIWGHANVTAGSATIDGKMIGTLSKTQAFGTWNIIAKDTEGTLYEFSGEWRAEKIMSRPSSAPRSAIEDCWQGQGSPPHHFHRNHCHTLGTIFQGKS